MESLSRSSNNCQAWAKNFQKLTKKGENVNALSALHRNSGGPGGASYADETIDMDNCGCGDIAEIVQAKGDVDDQYLLANEHTTRTEVGASIEKYECSIRSRRNSRISDQQDLHSDITKGNSG